MNYKKIAGRHWRWSAALVAVCSLAPLGLGAQDSAPPETTAAAELRVAREVVDREPVGESDAFAADVGQVAAWTRITGAENTVIEHVWRYRDMEWTVPLEIGSTSWRTWSRKIILPEWTGAWEVEIRDQEGNTLATTTFTISADAPATPSAPDSGGSTGSTS
jgi:hypothetical protein